MGDTSQVDEGACVSDEELAQAIFLAGRALLAIATRSLAAADHDVTLPQYRTLAAIARGGSTRLADLAPAEEASPEGQSVAFI